MKLSDIKGERAIDLLADLLEPAGEILEDEEVVNLVRSGKATRIEIVKTVLKRHQKSVIEIMALMDGEDPKTYEVNVLTLPAKLLEILNDQEFLDLFTLQGQKTVEQFSGSAMGSTKAKRK